MTQNNYSGSVSQFKPREIVCLEHNNSYLYGEVIQVIHWRQLCWVRPIMLAIAPDRASYSSSNLEIIKLVDLSMTSDLLWPINLFRSALDTEVIPLLMQLEASDSASQDIQKARQQLHHFIDRFWQARNK